MKGNHRKKWRKRNPQRKVLAKEMLKGKTLAEASKIAGYSHPNAASNALRDMRKDLVNGLYDEGWGPREFIRKHLTKMLQRKKILYFQNQGIVMDKRIVEDTDAQQRAGEMYLKIIGGYAPTEVEHSGSILHVMTETEKKEAAESLERIAAFEGSGENALLAEVVEE